MVFPITYDTVLIGAMRTCSHVPRSFSRTIDTAVEIAAVIMAMNAIRPGTRNNELRSSGLYQIRGSAHTSPACDDPPPLATCRPADVLRTIARA
jgi:hypothetical protein